MAAEVVLAQEDIKVVEIKESRVGARCFGQLEAAGWPRLNCRYIARDGFLLPFVDQDGHIACLLTRVAAEGTPFLTVAAWKRARTLQMERLS